MILKKKMDLRAHMTTPRGNIHVYYHNIQTSPPLKPHGQLKPNFMVYAADSGERLQDHWSSGFIMRLTE